MHFLLRLCLRPFSRSSSSPSSISRVATPPQVHSADSLSPPHRLHFLQHSQLQQLDGIKGNSLASGGVLSGRVGSTLMQQNSPYQQPQQQRHSSDDSATKKNDSASASSSGCSSVGTYYFLKRSHRIAWERPSLLSCYLLFSVVS